VKTGSDSMVTESCDGGSSGDGSSSYQGKISRNLAMSGRLTVLAPGEAACRAMLTKPEQSVRYLRPISSLVTLLELSVLVLAVLLVTSLCSSRGPIVLRRIQPRNPANINLVGNMDVAVGLGRVTANLPANRTLVRRRDRNEE
jgi:hypothetical protein